MIDTNFLCDIYKVMMNKELECDTNMTILVFGCDWFYYQYDLNVSNSTFGYDEICVEYDLNVSKHQI